jgi:hypothetical protein
MRALAGFAASSIAAVVLTLVAVSPAVAHQSPPGCDANSLDLTLTKDRTSIRNGDTSTYTVQIANDSGNACDITDATVSLTLPAADGSPSGQTVTLAAGVDYPAGTGRRVIGRVPWVVNLNPGVSNAIAQGNADGTLHDAPSDDDAHITKTLGTTATQPHATLDCSVSPSSGDTPLSVTLTCTLKNDSSTDAPLSDVGFSNDRCGSSPTRTGGDGNSTLDTGETWTYTCGAIVNDAGTTTSHAAASATNTVDHQPVTIAPDEVSVLASTPTTPGVEGGPPTSPESPGTPGSPGSPSTPSNPSSPSNPSNPSNPGQPSSGVLGQRLVSPNSRGARGDASCISTPRKLRIRARERTIVRVRVGENGTPAVRAVVRVIGPGFVTRKVTNRRGVAVFRVRAKRAGRLVIQSDRCLGADRVSVLRARRVSSDHTPEGTG